MTLQPLPSGFLFTVYEENFVFFFISVYGATAYCIIVDPETRTSQFTKRNLFNSPNVPYNDLVTQRLYDKD
jgi:hypothetical protein